MRSISSFVVRSGVLSVVLLACGCGNEREERERAREVLARRAAELEHVASLRERMLVAKRDLRRELDQEEYDPAARFSGAMSVQMGAFNDAGEEFMAAMLELKRSIVPELKEAGVSQAVADEVWREYWDERQAEPDMVAAGEQEPAEPPDIFD